MSGVIGDAFASDVCGLRRHRHLGARDHCPAVVRNCARKTSGGLTVQQGDEQTYQGTESDGEARLLAQHWWNPFRLWHRTKKKTLPLRRSWEVKLGYPGTADTAYKSPHVGKSSSF